MNNEMLDEIAKAYEIARGRARENGMSSKEMDRAGAAGALPVVLKYAYRYPQDEEMIKFEKSYQELEDTGPPLYAVKNAIGDLFRERHRTLLEPTPDPVVTMATNILKEGMRPEMAASRIVELVRQMEALKK